MKIWECLKVPGTMFLEDAVNTASATTTIQDPEPIEVVNPDPSSLVITDPSFINMRNNAFNIHREDEITTTVLPGNVDDTVETVELPINVTEVNECKLDTIIDSINAEAATDDVVEAVPVEVNVDETDVSNSVNTSDILNKIQNYQPEPATPTYHMPSDEDVQELIEKVQELTSAVELSNEPEYSLEEYEVHDIVNSIVEYSKKYFPNIPIRKEISKNFVYNIPKYLYVAHFNAAKKYGDHPIFDPIFYMTILFAEDPYEAIGEFIKVIMDFGDDTDIQNEIAAKIEEYDELLNSEDEEEVEEDDNNE